MPGVRHRARQQQRRAGMMAGMDVLRQLEWSLQALAQPGDVQLSLFPRDVVIADELALEFDNWYRTAKQDATRYSPEQAGALGALDAKLQCMSGIGKPHWSDHALCHDPEWEDIRRLARLALHVFGWKDAAPAAGPPGVAYLPAKRP